MYAPSWVCFQSIQFSETVCVFAVKLFGPPTTYLSAGFDANYPKIYLDTG